MSASAENVALLPIWKKNASAGERLRELAQLADKHPVWFEKWVLVYCEDNEERFVTRTCSGESTRTSDKIAVLEAGKLDIWEAARR